MNYPVFIINLDRFIAHYHQQESDFCRNALLKQRGPASPRACIAPATFAIVGELQLTTIASVKIKKIQHKVYEVRASKRPAIRAFEGACRPPRKCKWRGLLDTLDNYTNLGNILLFE